VTVFLVPLVGLSRKPIHRPCSILRVNGYVSGKIRDLSHHRWKYEDATEREDYQRQEEDGAYGAAPRNAPALYARYCGIEQSRKD